MFEILVVHFFLGIIVLAYLAHIPYRNLPLYILWAVDIVLLSSSSGYIINLFSTSELIIFILSAFSSSILFSVASFSFMVTVVWLWYINRDKEVSKLFGLEVVAVVFGVLYNIFKFFNHL